MLVIGLTRYDDRQYHPQRKITPVAIDTNAVANRLAEAIKIPTVSSDDPSAFNPLPFKQFVRFLEHTYPVIHQHAERVLINEFSMVYKFQGQNTTLKPALFMGHTDVVSVDEIEALTGIDFFPELENGVENKEMSPRVAFRIKNIRSSLLKKGK